jgi:hypothetical protein
MVLTILFIRFSLLIVNLERQPRLIICWPTMVLPLVSAVKADRRAGSAKAKWKTADAAGLSSGRSGRIVGSAKRDRKRHGPHGENLTIRAASKHPDFSLLDWQRLLIWQRRLYKELESASDRLLPTE